MGRHTFPVRQIAVQAGVSDATVDRVLHGREGVRASTAARVRRAIADLERQQAEFELAGRTFTVDLVMQTPRRFSSAVRAAFDAVVPTFRPATFRIRPHLFETVAPAKVARALDDVRRRGSAAVILKAPDVPAVVEAVDEVSAAGLPVFTLVTDLPTSRRLAYVGIDNRAAGATAAYLIDRWLGPVRATLPATGEAAAAPATVLVTMSSGRFRGEEEREAGFRSAARRIAPGWRIADLAETQGLDRTIEAQLDAVARAESIDAVYSIGGGNRAILRTLDRRGRRPAVFIAHDLDEDNRALLESQRVSAVLHHDLRADAARLCRLVMQAHRAVPGVPATELAPVQVITPYNLPS